MPSSRALQKTLEDLCVWPIVLYPANGLLWSEKIPYTKASFACFNIFKLAFICVKLDWGRNCIVLCWEKMLMSLGAVSINGNGENGQLVWSSAQIDWFSFSAAFSVPADMSGCINVVGEWGCKIPSKIQWELIIYLLQSFEKIFSFLLWQARTWCWMHISWCAITWDLSCASLRITVEITRHDLCFPVHLSFSLVCPCDAQWKLQRWCSVGLILNSIHSQSSL